MTTTANDDEWEEDDEGEDEDTIPCPYCKAEIYDGAEQCPKCGRYISEEDAPAEAKPRWIVIASVLCLVIAILWVWKG